MSLPSDRTSPRKQLGELLIEQDWIAPSELVAALEEQQQGAHAERLGEILKRRGLVSGMAIDAVVAFRDGALTAVSTGTGPLRQRLGDILLQLRRITPRQLDRALEEQRRTNERLGTVLVRFGLITEVELEAILRWQEEGTEGASQARFRLGEILHATGQISANQLREALKAQKLTRRQIGEILVAAGYVQPSQIREALRIQQKLLAASLLGMMAVGGVTGCGLTGAPTVPAFSAITGTAQGSVLPFTGDPQQAVGRYQVSGAHTVTTYADGTKVVDGVPFFQQDVADNTCAQACMSLELNFWKPTGAADGISYQQVVDESNRFNLPTSHQTITSYLDGKGLTATAYRGAKLGFLEHLIDQGRPPIVLLDFGSLAEHYVVVVGYNPSQGTVIIHDSIDGPYSQMPFDEFNQRWQNASLSGVPFVDGENYQGLIIDVQGR